MVCSIAVDPIDEEVLTLSWELHIHWEMILRPDWIISAENQKKIKGKKNGTAEKCILSIRYVHNLVLLAE